MNNGIFVQDVYDKIGSDNGLPRPLVGNPSLPMPYHCFGPESRLDFKNLILVVDLAFSQSNTITFTAAGGATRNFSIDWGDGIIEQYTSYSNTSYSHTYNARGIYTIQIAGDLPAPRFSSASQPILIKINSFGQIIISPANYSTAFRFNTNLIAVAANLPSNTSTIFQIFFSCAKLNDPNISLWNTSNITDMGSSFSSATSFNQPINSWNTSNAISMSSMFSSATSFNQSLENWNVRKVTSFSNMFQSATNFNSSLSGWALGADTAGTSCSSMFSSCVNFNQDLSSWDVSKVTNFSSMFNGARSFNQSLNGWQLVSSGVNCTSMFFNAINFNQNLGTWNTSGITNASSMFNAANSFTGQGIDSWTLPSVTTASNMFLNCFNLAPTGSLSGWGMGSCTDMTRMFYSAGNNVSSNFSGLNSWNTSSCTNMSEMFFNSRFNNSLSNWDVSKVTTFNGMFNGALDFNQSLSNWNIAGINVNTGLDNFMNGKTGANAYSTANYDALLIGWNNNKLVGANGVANWRTDLRPNFGGAKYTAGGAAATARAALVSYGWTITDGGVA